MINNIRNNTISEISAKKGLNTLNELKNTGITKQKKCTPKQKEVLHLFNNLLDTILTDKTLMSSKDKNEKEIKNLFTKNDVMTTIIKRCRGEKTRGIRAIDGFRKKLMIPDFEIPKCPEFEVKSKI